MAYNSRALANCAKGVVEHGIRDLAAQIPHKDVEVVTCVLLVIVWQGPIHAEFLSEVALAIQGSERCLSNTSVGEFDKPIACAAARTLILQRLEDFRYL